MTRLGRPPITLAVPALVAGLMIAVSIVVSERVLTRLVGTQERQLAELSATYLDGLSSSLQPQVLREDVWEVFDALDRAKSLYGALRPIQTVVVATDARVIAASDPTEVAAFEPLPALFADRLGDRDLVIDAADGRAYLRRSLDYHGTPIGDIYAVVDIGHLLSERREVTATLIATNALLTVLFASAGYLAVRRMVQPVRVLTDHLSAGLTGRPVPIAPALMPPSGTEARRLFEAYNALAGAEREREALSLKLAEEERLASLGRLASGMAHEINNPLGGLFNAVGTIKRHGDTRAVRQSAVHLLERGLHGIRDVVTATLQTYRPDRGRPFVPADLEDIRLLIRPELRRRAIDLAWSNRLVGPLDTPSAPLRQAVLNLLLNACAAVPEGGKVALQAWQDDRLAVEVADNGPGLPPTARAILTTPASAAPIGACDGLGLWMVRRLVAEVGGSIVVGRSALGGALLRIEIPVAPANSEDRERLHGAA